MQKRVLICKLAATNEDCCSSIKLSINVTEKLKSIIYRYNRPPLYCLIVLSVDDSVHGLGIEFHRMTKCFQIFFLFVLRNPLVERLKETMHELEKTYFSSNLFAVMSLSSH